MDFFAAPMMFLLAVGTWKWQQARQALQSTGKSLEEIFDAADKDKNGTVDGEQSSRDRSAKAGLKSDRKTPHSEA